MILQEKIFFKFMTADRWPQTPAKWWQKLTLTTDQRPQTLAKWWQKFTWPLARAAKN